MSGFAYNVLLDVLFLFDKMSFLSTILTMVIMPYVSTMFKQEKAYVLIQSFLFR
jgi:hypothetical protein